MKTITYDDTLYQLVPKEPTDEMVEAAWESDAADYVGEHKRIWQAGLAYIAMLSAAPTPPAQPEAATPVAGGGEAVAKVVKTSASRNRPFLTEIVWLAEKVPTGTMLYTNPQPQPVPDDVVKDAERYRLLRRGQKWSVLDGIGDVLRADSLDSAIDAAILKEGK